ncbi:MAG TPA: DUF6544 family protein [Telluria sp.]|jgi:hypothetical protein
MQHRFQINSSMLKTSILIVLIVAAAGAAAALYGAYDWQQGTNQIRARLDGARVPGGARMVDFRDLEGLPPPVQRYFRTVLKDGAPIVAGVSIQHEGRFNMGETSDRWKPFSSDQKVVTRRPGFDWDGRISMLPGLPVRVHDTYIAGEGSLHAAVLGVLTVADIQGAGNIAQGELMRFVAEAAWYPTALLPGQGVRWEAVDARAARASLVDGAIKLTLLFTFNDQGLIETVRADARGRTLGKQIVATPWQGHFWNYQAKNGMQVPLDGEVAWLLPEGTKPYWRGTIKKIAYEFVH